MSPTSIFNPAYKYCGDLKGKREGGGSRRRRMGGREREREREREKK